MAWVRLLHVIQAEFTALQFVQTELLRNAMLIQAVWERFVVQLIANWLALEQRVQLAPSK